MILNKPEAVFFVWMEALLQQGKKALLRNSEYISKKV
jgi:hypothetical protein